MAGESCFSTKLLEFNMIFLQIRVSGLSWRPESFVEQFQITNCQIWNKGDEMAHGRGGAHMDSGFAFSLPNQDSWSSALPVIRSMLSAQTALFNALAQQGVQTELSIGVTVGEKTSFAPSLEFPVELLASLHAATVGLMLTAYPASNE
jgi:hypothetical protein